MSYLVNPYKVTPTAYSYWYEHTDNTIDSYIYSRSTSEGGQNWRWGIKLTASENDNTLNAMDIQFRIFTGTPTMTVIGRLWDDSNPPTILDTLNFESSGSGTTITGSDLTSSFEWYSATASNPQTVLTNYVVGIEATNEGTSPTSNYFVTARTEWVPSPTPSNYGDWAGSTSQTWSYSPYYMNQRMR